MLLSKAAFLVLLPFLVQVFAHPSGKTPTRENDVVDQALTESNSAVKRQDDTTDTNDVTGDDTTDTTILDSPDTSGSDAGQAAQYAQCGGLQFTGPTTCVSPYVCQYSNDYYSQCL
jgi:hypothetical protein